MSAPYLINPDNPDCQFPDISLALEEPDGLLAVGGNLHPQCLLNAYRKGIFPWYSDDQPILWWSPDPRTVLCPNELKISRSLRKTLRSGRYRITIDEAFAEVINGCADSRTGIDSAETGTWITSEMKQAYLDLHHLGYAHSAETWHNDTLVGGLYGVAIGKVFFGESMFFTKRDASKVAFVTLVHQLKDWGYVLIDCQIATPHLESLGAKAIDRQQFCHILEQWCAAPGEPSPWTLELSREDINKLI